MRIIGSDYFNRITFLKRGKFDFKMVKTTNTTQLYFYNTKELYTYDRISPKYLHLFAEIKNHVLKNIEGRNIPNYEAERQYFRFSKIPANNGKDRAELFNLYEFDINKAYYFAAKNLGFISEAFFNKYINLPKSIRLKLIGSIATQKHTYKYEKGDLIDYTIENNPELRKVWFMIVNEVNNALFHFSERIGESFLFYWVDGIYCKKHDYIEEILEELDQVFKFEFKKINIDKMTIERGKNNLDKITIQTEDKRKVFTIKNILI
jgi:hypothetical protein